jgi:cyclic beta-1,2-glucan synthetase
MQLLTTTLLLSLTRPQAKLYLHQDVLADTCDRRLLWHFGISGDRPIIVVHASVLQDVGLLRSMVQAMRIWSWAGVACDLVVINAEPSSYLRSLQYEITALQERFTADMGSPANSYGAAMGFHVVRIEELTVGEISTLRALARVWLQADGRPLTLHVKELCELHEQAFEVHHTRSDCPYQHRGGSDACGCF